MKRLFSFIFSTFFLFIICSSCSSSFKPYEIPQKNDLGNNEYEYINSPLYEGSDAGVFNPALESAEAAVVKFLSSKSRKDEIWKEALIPETEWTDRLKRKLSQWDKWKITKWQLKRIETDENRAYLTVYFEIEYEGDTDDGEDEFELILKNGKWMVLYPPT